MLWHEGFKGLTQSNGRAGKVHLNVKWSPPLLLGGFVCIGNTLSVASTASGRACRVFKKKLVKVCMPVALCLWEDILI